MNQRGTLIVGSFQHGSEGIWGPGVDLAAHLSESGWWVGVTPTTTAPLSRLAEILSTLWRKRREYTVAQVEVYSGRAFLWAEISCLALRLLGKPCVLALHGGNLPEFACRRPRRVRRLLTAAQVVTVPSRYLQDRMHAYRSSLPLLPNAVNLATYPFRQRSRPQPRLVWLRAFHSIYNPELAPQVIALLQGQFPGIFLTMVGPDKGDGSLHATKRVAEELGVQDRIHWTGGVPKAKVPKWLNAGDIFINTTNVDNTPVSVLEAMACGLCVVSTNVGGIPYLLEHEGDALLVPLQNPKAMAAAVKRVLVERDLAAHISQNGRKKVEQFDWAVILPQWEELLRKAASSRA